MFSRVTSRRASLNNRVMEKRNKWGRVLYFFEKRPHICKSVISKQRETSLVYTYWL